MNSFTNIGIGLRLGRSAEAMIAAMSIMSMLALSLRAYPAGTFDRHKFMAIANSVKLFKNLWKFNRIPLKFCRQMGRNGGFVNIGAHRFERLRNTRELFHPKSVTRHEQTVGTA